MNETMMTMFVYSGMPVRVSVQDDGEPFWIAKDVCDVLGLLNNRQALAKLDDDQKGVVLTDTPGGHQEMSTVTESGLYELIFRSEKPEAKQFRKWVTSVVLPAIRKTGKYELPVEVQKQLRAERRRAERQIKNRDALISAQRDVLVKQIKVLRDIGQTETKKQRKARRRKYFAERARQLRLKSVSVISSAVIAEIIRQHQDGVCWSDISRNCQVSWRDVEHVARHYEHEQRRG